jgi:hypothetical protein
MQIAELGFEVTGEIVRRESRWTSADATPSGTDSLHPVGIGAAGFRPNR